MLTMTSPTCRLAALGLLFALMSTMPAAYVLYRVLYRHLDAR